jgi:6-phosphogluconate dehydrogenase
MSDVGMIGLAVMGANLARNLESKGFECAVFNRTTEVTKKFVDEWSEKRFRGTSSLVEFVQVLKKPRIIFVMVKAGAPVDAIVNELKPLVDKGDIILDGGNSHYRDTERREKECASLGIHFMGVGISGGEEGALHGPSMMPGGTAAAWTSVQPILEKISAQVQGPCTGYMGPGGSGHFVKMVHNGIEYADMQLIAEVYDIMRKGLELSPSRIGDIFNQWNEGPLQSFLTEITSKIFTVKDEGSNAYLVDRILDQAGQKGTGRWTVEAALECGVPLPTISASVDARALSARKAERVSLAALYKGVSSSPPQPNADMLKALHDALLAGKMLAYAQGLHLLKAASDEFKWNLNLGEVSAVWRGGCIIRARFLHEIREVYREMPKAQHLLYSPRFQKLLVPLIQPLRTIVGFAQGAGVPVGALSSSLTYYDSMVSAVLPQNLTQAQRDFFGAHTYQRIDREGVFHTQWE